MLKKLKRARNTCTGDEYIRMIAMSRIMLPNVKNIQASWLTVGKKVGQLSLHAGANDFGSIMIEENVVSVAGANNQFDAIGIQQAIRERARDGEIWMLDAANYNTATVNVTKSVTILAMPGVMGSVLAIGGPALSMSNTAITVMLSRISLSTTIW